MLQARWKGGTVAESATPQEVRAGQVRSFRITKLDRPPNQIEVELV
jgi:small subunit ribosomal protein S1